MLVRVTHWITVSSFVALLVTGVEILISRPRFDWGEVGNSRTPSTVQDSDPFFASDSPATFLMHKMSLIFLAYNQDPRDTQLLPCIGGPYSREWSSGSDRTLPYHRHH